MIGGWYARNAQSGIKKGEEYFVVHKKATKRHAPGTTTKYVAKKDHPKAGVFTRITKTDFYLCGKALDHKVSRAKTDAAYGKMDMTHFNRFMSIFRQLWDSESFRKLFKGKTTGGVYKNAIMTMYKLVNNLDPGVGPETRVELATLWDQAKLKAGKKPVRSLSAGVIVGGRKKIKKIVGGKITGWISFVRKYMKKYGISFKEALVNASSDWKRMKKGGD
jgi:hypothetical protein